MRNSEDLSTHEHEYPVASIELPEEIKAKIVDILSFLKDVLANNLEFADELIKKSLLLGYGMTTNEITNLIWDEYPDLYEYKRGAELINVVYSLGKITGLTDNAVKRIIDSMGFEWHSAEERVICDKLHDNIQKFISDNWGREDFTHEVELLAMTNQFDKWDTE